MRKLWEANKVKVKEGVSNREDHIRKRRSYCKCVHVRVTGDVERMKKSVIRSACTKRMFPNKFHGILFVYWSGQVP